MYNKTISTSLSITLIISTLVTAASITGCAKNSNTTKESDTKEKYISSESVSNTTIEDTSFDIETDEQTFDSEIAETTSITTDESSFKDCKEDTTDVESTQTPSTEKSKNVPESSAEKTKKEPSTTGTQTNKPKETSKPTTEEIKHTHSYSAADCTHAATCSCGATKGSALGHDYGDNRKTCSRCGKANPNYKEPHTHSYKAADCTHAATCSCGATKGSALGHDYGDNRKTCSRCGKANPNYKESSGSGVGEVREHGFYTYEDLVANGICPEGYCVGSTVRVYEVRESDGWWHYYVEINFSGERCPKDFVETGEIFSSDCMYYVSFYLYLGQSKTACFAKRTGVSAG